MAIAFKFLHILFAAAWFGHKILIPGDIRMSTGSGSETGPTLLRRLARAERLGIVSGLGTLVFGAALLFEVGIDTVTIGVWVGVGLTIAAIAVGAIVGRPTARRLRAAISDGDRTEAAAAGAQMSRVLRAESLLWIGALAAMVI